MLLFKNIITIPGQLQVNGQNSEVQRSNIEFLGNFKDFHLQWYQILSAILIVFVLVVFLFRNTRLSYKNLIKDSEIAMNVKEIRHYFLILGILLPILEMFIEFFRIRLQSELWMTITLGILAEIIYFTSAKNKFLQKNIQTIFVLFFFMMSGLYFYKTIFMPFEVITFSQLLIVIFFSFTIFRTTKQFHIFVGGVMVLFTALLFTDLIPLKNNIIYLYSIIIIFILNYVWRLSILNSRHKLLFANNIVHNGSSLIIATDRFGAVSFCSDNIIKILGYTSQQAMGMGFWEITEDNEFEGLDYSEKYIEDKIYIRKLKCKNGKFKYIQWLDKKYDDDLYVGIGQDVTEQVTLQEKYKSIVENATDIIYETDYRGIFLFFNEVAMRMLGYSYDELFDKHFSFLIRDDYKKIIADFYSKPDPVKNYFDAIEFPIIAKNCNEHWVSKK